MTITPIPALHKFVSADRLISILRSPSIRFTQPQFLNDPYECHLSLDKSAVLERYKAFRKQAEPGINDAQLSNALTIAEDQLVVDALLQYRERRKSLGVVSLSEDPLNLLMWSHYGDEHRGAAIELDWSHPKLRPGSFGGDEFSGLVKVEYTNRKIFGLPDPDTIVDVLSTKSPHWSYELEWRLIRTLNLTRHVHSDIYVVDFDLSAIRTIYLGANFDGSLIPEMNKFCSDNGGEHIRFMKVNVAPHKFELRAIEAGRHGWMLLHRDHHFGEAAPEALTCLPMDTDQ